MWRAFVASVAPNPRLAAHPLLAGLNANELRRWGKAADEVEFAPGEPLLREDHIGYWFFLIVDGSVELRRGSRRVGSRRAGEHLGREATIDGRPEPATVVATTPVRAFVVGRRHLMPLIDEHGVVRRRLYPDLGDGDFHAALRELRAAADLEWRALSRERVAKLLKPAAPLKLQQRPGRLVRAAPVPLPIVVSAFLGRGATAVARPAAPERLSRRARLVIAGAAMAALIVGGMLYHPPMVLVTPSPPVDVVADITVSGAPVHRVSGQYLLVPVRFDRPNALRAVYAVVMHHRRVRALEGEAATAARMQAAAAFETSRKDAVVAAARSVGVPVGPKGELPFSVSFRQRDIGGASGGLIYALALADMLDGADVARGRTIAATGAIGDDGRVVPIGFITEKAKGARRAGGQLFLVPARQAHAASGHGVAVYGVRTVGDAWRVLRARPSR